MEMQPQKNKKNKIKVQIIFVDQCKKVLCISK